MRLFPEQPKKETTLFPSEQLQQEILADYRRLGILPLYEKLFAQIQVQAKQIKEQYIGEGMEEEKAEAISQQAKHKAEAEAIRLVQEKYLEALNKTAANMY